MGVASGVNPRALDEFWARRFATPDGGNLSLASLRGQPLLVNFWATWCPPCIEELPLLNRFYAENKANGWQLLGLAVDQVDPVRRFLARTPVDFLVGMARQEGSDLMRQLGNTVNGLPFTVVFGPDGRPWGHKIGQVSGSELEKWRGLGRAVKPA
jgi:thiol-disulfide isomerase/thioredoxin